MYEHSVSEKKDRQRKMVDGGDGTGWMVDGRMLEKWIAGLGWMDG